MARGRGRPPKTLVELIRDNGFRPGRHDALVAEQLLPTRAPEWAGQGLAQLACPSGGVNLSCFVGNGGAPTRVYWRAALGRLDILRVRDAAEAPPDSHHA